MNKPQWGQSGDDRRAEVIEQAFQRLETLLSDGMPRLEAVAIVSADLPVSEVSAFEIGAGLGAIELKAPDSDFAARLERQLADAAAGAIPLRPRTRTSAPHRRLVATAMAACVLLVAGLTAGAFRSLPGDALYPAKRTAEATRLKISSERNAATYHIVLADRRLGEAQGLIERSQNESLALAGTGTFAAAGEISDPAITALIEKTLSEARTNLMEASSYLIRVRDTKGLERIVVVAHRGQQIVSDANAVLGRHRPLTKLAETDASLKLIERVAQQARDQIVVEDDGPVTPAPCATPTPTPEATASAAPTPPPSATPTATPAASATPTSSETPTPVATASPAPTPSPTPCVSPTPSPTPVPTAKPSARPTSTPSPKPAATPAATVGPQSSATPAPSGEPSTAGDSTPNAARSCSFMDKLLQRC